MPTNLENQRLAELTAELTVRRLAHELLDPLRVEVANLRVEMRDNFVTRVDCKATHEAVMGVMQEALAEEKQSRRFRDRLGGAWYATATIGAFVGGLCGAASLLLHYLLGWLPGHHW